MTKISSNKYEFIIPVCLKVLNAHYETYITKDSNKILGKEREIIKTEVILKVEQFPHLDTIDIITSLIFKGYCNIERGDWIKAYIEKYYEINGGYAERDFLKVERISRIEKLGIDGKILAEFHGFPTNV